MSTSTDWQAGDPLLTDNGCGPMPSVHMTEDERATVIAEGGVTPPWWRPGADGPAYGYSRSCDPCGVRWRGEGPCWSCGVGA